MENKSILNLKRFIALLIFLTLIIFGGRGNVVYAKENPLEKDSIYEVPVDFDGLIMGTNNFSSKVKIEVDKKFNYYMTFGHSSSISNLKLITGDKESGYTIRTDSGWTYYTYTLGLENLSNSLNFKAYISAMNQEASFSIKVKLDSANRISDYVDIGERPAEFVPVIKANGGNVELEKGTVFMIPEAKAYIGSDEAKVNVKAYYNDLEIEVNDNKIILENVGKYVIKYVATSSLYKTNYGNDAFSSYEVTILSKVGATTLAKFDDKSNALPEGTILQASKIEDGKAYDSVAEKMKNISDNYSLINIVYYSASGEALTPKENVTLYFMPETYLDRNEVKIYHVSSDGEFVDVLSSPFGRYVKADTNLTGTFVIYTPGVEFHMPMWGYASIAIGAVLVLAAAITVPVVIHVRKKKKEDLEA